MQVYDEQYRCMEIVSSPCSRDRRSICDGRCRGGSAPAPAAASSTSSNPPSAHSSPKMKFIRGVLSNEAFAHELTEASERLSCARPREACSHPSRTGQQPWRTHGRRGAGVQGSQELPIKQVYDRTLPELFVVSFHCRFTATYPARLDLLTKPMCICVAVSSDRETSSRPCLGHKALLDSELVVQRQPTMDLTPPSDNNPREWRLPAFGTPEDAARLRQQPVGKRIARIRAAQRVKAEQVLARCGVKLNGAR
jgi:hypothetical protein